MEYAKVVDNTFIIDVFEERPHWIFDGGIPVSDEWLIENEGIYPVEDNYNDNISYIDLPSDDWTILPGIKVIKTYLPLVDDNIDIPNPLLDMAVLKPKDQWIWGDDIVIKTYSVVERSDSDIDNFINNNNIDENGFEINKHIIKPKNQWIWDELNHCVKKTYWNIIPDPQILDYPEDFYVHNVKNQDQWIWGDDTVQQTFDYNILPLNDIKLNVINAVTYRRWVIETGGYIFNGYNIHTDRESQMKLSSIYTLVKNDDIIDDMKWKTMSGFITFTSQEMVDLSLYVSGFVSQLYNKESLIINQINNSTTIDMVKVIYNTIDDLLHVDNSVVLSK